MNHLGLSTTVLTNTKAAAPFLLEYPWEGGILYRLTVRGSMLP